MRHLRVLVAVMALVMAVAACGGGDDASDDTTADTTAATTGATTAATEAPATTTATETTDAPTTTAGETTMAPSGDVAEFEIVADGNKFSVEEIRVEAGQEVHIVINDRDTGTDEPHNFHVRAGGLNFFTEIKDAPNTQELTFVIDTPGEYTFFCDTHLAEMTGLFIVEDGM